MVERVTFGERHSTASAGFPPSPGWFPVALTSSDGFTVDQFGQFVRELTAYHSFPIKITSRLPGKTIPYLSEIPV